MECKPWYSSTIKKLVFLSAKSFDSLIYLNFHSYCINEFAFYQIVDQSDDFAFSGNTQALHTQ